jgi:LAGLIDADG-like domain
MASRPNGYSAPWTAADAAYLRDNYGKLPAKEIAATLGRSLKSIYGQVGLDKSLRTRESRPWTAAEEDVIRQNLGRIPEAEIGRMIGRSARAVGHHAVQEMGLTRQDASKLIAKAKLDDLRRQHQAAAVPMAPPLTYESPARAFADGGPIPRKTLIALSTVHDYFCDVVSAEQAYILGLLAADGNVASRHPRIVFGLQAKDAWLVEWVRDRLNPMASLYRTPEGFTKIQVTSAQMVSDLAAFGVVPRKSRILGWPHHLGALLPYFLLGYFDGDGTSYVIRDKYPGWSVCSGSREFLEDMKDYILATTGVVLEKIHHRPNTGLWQVATTSLGAFVLDEWLHQERLGLARKRYPEYVVARYRAA